jgi:ABC-type transporter Mla subunit MlaD
MAEDKNTPPSRRRRRRPANLDEGSTANLPNNEDQNKDNDQPKVSIIKPPKTLRKIRQELQVKFVGCFILGVLLIPLKPEMFYGLLPIGAMFLYLVIGFSATKITAAKSVFADSFYYLGFLFTFAALLFAISGKSSDIISITSQLGTALSTTIVGMLIRILISHFDPIETEVNNAVSDEMANMATQIRRLTEELTESIQEQLNAMMTISSASETQLSAINQALEKISNIDTPQESLNRFEEKISNVADGLNSLITNANTAKNTLQDFSNSTNNVATSLSASNQIVQDSQATAGAMRNMSNEVSGLANNLTQSFTSHLDAMRELSNLSNQQITSMNKALENISAINISQENIQNFDNNISTLGNRLNSLITNASEAETKLAQFATSTSAVSSVLASSGKIIKNTETTAGNLDRLQNELQDIVASANGEKNKLVSAVSEISKEIKQAKSVIEKTSDLSLQMEKTIEERMASILKLVRNG